MVEGRKSKWNKKGKQKSKRPAQHRVPITRFDPTTPLPTVPIPNTVIDDILAKRDLLVSRELAEHITRRYLWKNAALVPRVNDEKFMRSADYDKLKKWVRQELRVLVGMFVLEHDLDKLLDEPTAVILASHRSTAERQQHYPGLYDALFGERRPQKILDLAAGLNPCAYEYLGCTPTYYAMDVSPELMDFVNKWFVLKEIDGKAFTADVTKVEEFPDCDTMMIFKGLDVLERISYGYGEKLLDKFKEKRIIASFATATISGSRGISVKKRTWVERWANKNGKSVRTHEIPGELFYVLE